MARIHFLSNAAHIKLTDMECSATVLLCYCSTAKRRQESIVQRRKRNKRMMKARKEQAMGRVILCLMLCCSATSLYAAMREFCIQERNDNMRWEHIVLSRFSSHDWLINFRMSRSKFLFICNEIQHEITKSDTVIRRAITVEKPVAITLWVL